MQQATRELPGVRVRMGRLSDFSDAVLKENPTLPVVRTDPTDGWIHGIMQMPVETKLARNVPPEDRRAGRAEHARHRVGASLCRRRVKR